MTARELRNLFSQLRVTSQQVLPTPLTTSVYFGSSGSYTVPAGVATVFVTIVGGGGASGVSYPAQAYEGGGGGGGAAYVFYPIYNAAGYVLNFTVGSGGQGSGNGGGTTTLSTLSGNYGLSLTAGGGAGGTASTDEISGNGGTGGSIATLTGGTGGTGGITVELQILMVVIHCCILSHLVVVVLVERLDTKAVNRVLWYQLTQVVLLHYLEIQ